MQFMRFSGMEWRATTAATALAALALVGTAGQARADRTFALQNVTLATNGGVPSVQPGTFTTFVLIPAGTLTGTFTTDDTLTTVLTADITASASGSFNAFHYTAGPGGNSILTPSLPIFFQLDNSLPSPTQELRLLFFGGLTTSGADLQTTSYEFDTAGGQRFVNTGSVVAIGTTAPEPGSLALVGAGCSVLGVGGIGQVRKRRRH